MNDKKDPLVPELISETFVESGDDWCKLSTTVMLGFGCGDGAQERLRQKFRSDLREFVRSWGVRDEA